jgi:hypothetical protein
MSAAALAGDAVDLRETTIQWTLVVVGSRA